MIIGSMMKKPLSRPARQKNMAAELLAKNTVCREELSIARKIQAAMVPARLPAVDGLECASLYLPSNTVGGDLFDVVQISSDVIAITMFDVASSGVPAALISALAKVSFSNHIRLITSPRLVMDRVNEEMIRNVESNYFITACVAYLDLHDNKLTYCNAAHPYPLIYRRGADSLEPIKSTGVCLGVFDKAHFEEKTLYINSGDWLLFFTDGVYHLFSRDNELAGRKGLERALADMAKRGSPQLLIDLLKKRSERQPKGPSAAGLADDVSVVAIEFLTQSRKNQIKEKLGFNRDDPVYLQYISYFEEMDKATSIILSSMDSLGYADESIRKMKIILTELFANAIYHGNQGDHSKRVIIGHVIDRKKVTISILDEGEGFDPASVPDPTLPENLVKDCGRGLYIVKNYADSMEFNEKGNRVTIAKYHVTK
jgi:serine phosphatase RsbU (regulator of sigma subunit)/anti-sigma regulatory factor (Ser/Thr protein kinase)